MSKWKERGDEPNEKNLYACPILCFVNCELCRPVYIGSIRVKERWRINNMKIRDMIDDSKIQIFIKQAMDLRNRTKEEEERVDPNLLDLRECFKRQADEISTKFTPFIGRYFKNYSHCFLIQDVYWLSVGIQCFTHAHIGYMGCGTNGRCSHSYSFDKHVKIDLSFNPYSSNGVDILGAEEISDKEYSELAKKVLLECMDIFTRE